MEQASPEATAEAGLVRLWQLILDTSLEMRLSALRIPESEIPALAAEGLALTRLMKNNIAVISQQDAEQIYRSAFHGMRQD
jgi:alcohol dehydrogenase class IV